MFHMNAIIIIIAGSLFFVSFAAHIYIKLKMRPDHDELEQYYYEFEDQNPQLQKYNKLTRITYIAIVVSMLLLFLAITL